MVRLFWSSSNGTWPALLRALAGFATLLLTILNELKLTRSCVPTPTTRNDGYAGSSSSSAAYVPQAFYQPPATGQARYQPSAVQPQARQTQERSASEFAANSLRSPPVIQRQAESQLMPVDCSDIQLFNGTTASGIYRIFRHVGCGNVNNLCTFSVLCDLLTDGGGWTVIQSRSAGKTDFFRSWSEYKQGFGDLNGEFWIGNDYLSELTNRQNVSYEMLVQLEALDRSRITSLYDRIQVADENDNYRLALGNLFQDGSAVDNLANSRGNAFGTYDRDTDESPGSICGSFWRSGWWFEPNCAFTGNLNVPFEESPSLPHLVGVIWQGVTGDATIRSSLMKVRPIDFVKRSKRTKLNLRQQ